jgi:hypothetical protein
MFARWIAGLASKVSPTPLVEGEAGELVKPVRFDPELHAIGSRWQCWARGDETPEEHRYRLQVHLTTLQLALEEDLAAVLKERR